jgi:hypothetical protein
MKLRTRHNWLFSFTDLAFILLISMSMIPIAQPGIVLHFAEMEPPLVPDNAELVPISEDTATWELQVLSISQDRSSPFRLVRIDSGTGQELEAAPIDPQELLAALDNLRGKNIRPVLLPEKSSLSHDFLFAAGALSRVWGDGRSPTIVRPIGGGE